MLLNRAAPLRPVGELLETCDFALALDPGGMLGRQPLDQGADSVAKLEREVRRGGTHELPDVLKRRLPFEAVGLLELAHSAEDTGGRTSYGGFAWTGTSSVARSTCACSFTEIALSSPRIQTRL